MKDVLSFLGGAALGAAVGAAIVIFSAPKSGPDVRQSISYRFKGALEQGKDAARQREQELWADFNTRVKAPSGLPLREGDRSVSM